MDDPVLKPFEVVKIIEACRGAGLSSLEYNGLKLDFTGVEAPVSLIGSALVDGVGEAVYLDGGDDAPVDFSLVEDPVAFEKAAIGVDE